MTWQHEMLFSSVPWENDTVKFSFEIGTNYKSILSWAVVFEFIHVAIAG